MATGYFAGMLSALYRHTYSGQQVIARFGLVPLGRRWYVVRPDQVALFERRFARAQMGSLAATAVVSVMVSTLVVAQPAWVLAVVVAAIVPGALPWVTSGLTPIDLHPSDLVPVRRNEASVRYASATGAPMLWMLLVAGVVLTAGQLWALLTFGAWWTWLGTLLFSAATAYMGMLLWRLRRNT
jgi:hypothetical protein